MEQETGKIELSGGYVELDIGDYGHDLGKVEPDGGYVEQVIGKVGPDGG